MSRDRGRHVQVDQEQLLEMYRRMVRIRRFEETVTDWFQRGMVKGVVHTYVGQEATGVGVCMVLRADDLVVGSHRSHGHLLSKGAAPAAVFAEVRGKATGCCKGRGGSMHVSDLSVNCLGGLAIVGAGIPIAVGAALAFQMRRQDNVVVTFFGDGAANTGNFHEGLNLASVWKLPVVFALENNQWAVSTRCGDSSNVEDLSVRATSYGIPGVRVDGNDVLAVWEAAKAAVQRARRGEGPTLLVAETYRVEGHYAGGSQAYRDRREVEGWRAPERDPIPRLRDRLLKMDPRLAANLDAVDAEVSAELKEAAAFAQASPEPDPVTNMDYIYS
jgi:TPP-dependent pyruvate/acetoin dehydrogenase alpha subunit